MTSLEYACVSPLNQYVAALYWAVMTITSIGYGDIAAYPGNTVEQAVATSMMMIGSMAWGLILGTIVSNLSSLNPDQDAFRKTMCKPRPD